MTQVKFWAGIGSRNAPDAILKCMELISAYLSEKGYHLRSGGASGSDTAFYVGAKNYAYKQNHDKGNTIFEFVEATEYTQAHAKQIHVDFMQKRYPRLKNYTQYTKRLIARNAIIILGLDLKTPVDFVVCWTPNAEAVGGTGYGIRLAHEFNIPVFNLANKKHLTRIQNAIGYVII